jgi:trehalose/maltose hydrolase-like predicted phosphorylase
MTKGSGLVYWDNEMWILPPFISFDHGAAKANMFYRYARIAPAEEHAKVFSYNGTFFPWNTAYTGEAMDLNPVFDPFMVHSVGDIAVELRTLFYATQDINWLKTVGYPLAQGIANFWKSRVTCNATSPSCSITNVCPPDEYAIGIPASIGVTDSVFTNYVAKISFDFATEAAQRLGLTPDPTWASISQKLVILFDPILKIHTEYQGFPKGNVVYKFVVKQADVILLQYPLDIQMPDDVRLNDIKFYNQFYDPTGPGMTRSISAIVWLDFNQTMAQFELNEAQENIQKPFGTLLKENFDVFVLGV